jgi:hypothetical protein|tara:strand:- start:1679 stop:2122 length:444 start_codon:yes stop_codon:yes gene_type:complete
VYATQAQRRLFMNDERISEVETKLYTHEGRINHAEADVRHIVGNIDRIEEHMLRGATKPINYMPIISGVVGLLGVMGTAVFGIMNYVDLQLVHVQDKKRGMEVRVMQNSEHIKDLTEVVLDRLGRLEERQSTIEGDVTEHDQNGHID